MRKSLKLILLGTSLMLPSTVLMAQDDLSQVIATVNGEEIQLSDLRQIQDQLPPNSLQGTPEEQLDQLLSQIAIQNTLANKAVDSVELDAQIQAAIRATRANAAIESYIEENLTDEYLQKSYDEAIGSQPDQMEWNAAHILVTSEEDAKAVIERLNGGEDFAEVAKEASTGPSGPNGGDLGWFGPGQMVPEFEAAVQGLEKGGISAPVQTQFGWHVVILNDVRTAQKPSFEEVEPQLRDFASSQLVEEYLNTLRAENEITLKDGVDASILGVSAE